jgi:hypothetical protein
MVCGSTALVLSANADRKPDLSCDLNCDLNSWEIRQCLVDTASGVGTEVRNRLPGCRLLSVYPEASEAIKHEQ